MFDALAQGGVDVGSFHPLRTFSDWETGARSLAGCHAAITTGDRLSSELAELDESFGVAVFHVPARTKSLYYVATAVSASDMIDALVSGEELFEAAGVDQAVAGSLVETVVTDMFEIGVLTSLTGSIVWGDVGAVVTQVEAVTDEAPAYIDGFKAMGRVSAELAGGVS